LDAVGAKELQRRFDAHAQWQEAEAVRDGRQPSADPDAHDLVEIGDGVRLYRADRLIKKLIDGRWERIELDEDEARR
jgi:hypothetical protein